MTSYHTIHSVDCLLLREEATLLKVFVDVEKPAKTSEHEPEHQNKTTQNSQYRDKNICYKLLWFYKLPASKYRNYASLVVHW